MPMERQGVESEFLIKDAETEASYYEGKAESCLPAIIGGAEGAYHLAIHYAKLVEVYQKRIDLFRKSADKDRSC